MPIAYSDGHKVESVILEILKNQTDLSSRAAIASNRYTEWPIRYHLCPQRANLLRHLNFQGLDVLELGAGMGGVSRFIAENAQSLTVVEGTEPRFEALSSRLRDLKNWTGIVANIQDVELDQRFDVVCVIGVLEYAEMFIEPDEDGGDPFQRMLKKARSFLKPDGVLIIAIENKLGLKYWRGALEDHTGRPYDGICGYSLNKSPRTFSRSELLDRLMNAGFGHVDEFYPFPDYKVPSAVIGSELFTVAPSVSADLASNCHYESYSGGAIASFSDQLAVHTVAKAGLAPEMANSFLFVAGPSEESGTRSRLLNRTIDRHEVAWHYALRQDPVVTTIHLPSAEHEKPWSSKEHLYDDTTEATLESGRLTLRWRSVPAEDLAEGEPLRWVLANHAYFGSWNLFRDDLEGFIRWGISKWTVNSEESEVMLSGEAVDAIHSNAFLSQNVSDCSERFTVFDLEWAVSSPIPATWYVFRNVYNLVKDCPVSSGVPFESLADLYEQLCSRLGLRSQFDRDNELETTFQNLIFPQSFETAHSRVYDSMKSRTLVRFFVRNDAGPQLTLARRVARRIRLRLQLTAYKMRQITAIMRK